MPFRGKQNLIILPTYNERRNIESIVQAIWNVLPETHILIVDDNSPDGTGRLADALATSEQKLFVLHRYKDRGLGPAYLDGFRWALQNTNNYQSIFEMDADFSHQPKYLPTLLEALTDSDIVLGCRYMTGGGVEGWATHRQWLSKLGNLYAKKLLHLNYKDLTGGFKCFHRRALETLNLDSIQSNGYNFQVEVTHQAHHKGLRITEVPIVFVEREQGVSKMNWGICLEAITGMWTSRKSTDDTPLTHKQ